MNDTRCRYGVIGVYHTRTNLANTLLTPVENSADSRRSPASPTRWNDLMTSAALLDNSAWVLLGSTEHVVRVPLTWVLGRDFAHTA
jgi:hypothetical protein